MEKAAERTRDRGMDYPTAKTAVCAGSRCPTKNQSLKALPQTGADMSTALVARQSDVSVEGKILSTKCAVRQSRSGEQVVVLW